MKALKMTTRHDPDMGEYGDCLRTALACLLDCDRVNEVPHFFEDGCSAETGFYRMEQFLYGCNLAPFYFASSADDKRTILKGLGLSNPTTYYMLIGTNENGADHAVICHGEHMIHDPAWGGNGVVAPTTAGHYIIIILVPISQIG